MVYLKYTAENMYRTVHKIRLLRAYSCKQEGSNIVVIAKKIELLVKMLLKCTLSFISAAKMHNDIRFVDITDGATHYHADYVSPSWAKTKTRTTEIGDHIFYRWEKK